MTNDKINQESINDKERQFKYLLTVRNLEVEQFWDRTNFLIAVQGVVLTLFVGSFSNHLPSLVIMCVIGFGIFFSYFIFDITLHNKFWVEYWEKELLSAQKELPNLTIFNPILHDSDIDPQIKQSHFPKYKSTKNATLWICKCFIGLWISLGVYETYYIITTYPMIIMTYFLKWVFGIKVFLSPF